MGLGGGVRGDGAIGGIDRRTHQGKARAPMLLTPVRPRRYHSRKAGCRCEVPICVSWLAIDWTIGKDSTADKSVGWLLITDSCMFLRVKGAWQGCVEALGTGVAFGAMEGWNVGRPSAFVPQSDRSVVPLKSLQCSWDAPSVLGTHPLVRNISLQPSFRPCIAVFCRSNYGTDICKHDQISAL